MRTLLILLLSIFCSIDTYSQTIDEHYEHAYQQIKDMLEGKSSLDFKRAVFVTEQAYFGGELDESDYNSQIEAFVNICLARYQQNYSSISPKDRSRAVNEIIYQFMTAYNATLLNEHLFISKPFQYNHTDGFGKIDWTHTFVTKLLDTQQGNCQSLTYFYKILADELGANAHLALAPNHIYLKHRWHGSENGWYNTELTNQTFPSDAWLMASGYISLEALQHGLYLEALTNQQLISMTLIDLAQGYARKQELSFENIKFQLQCVEFCLEYFPNYINGLLLKAKLLQQQYDLYKSLETLNKLKELCGHITQLGYQQIPEKSYINWLMPDLRNRFSGPYMNHSKEMLNLQEEVSNDISKDGNVWIGEILFDKVNDRIIAFKALAQHTITPAEKGRFMSIDPLEYRYPYYSGYSYVANSPIIAVDGDGRKIFIATTSPFMETTFQALQRLTNFKLEINEETGEVTIAGEYEHTGDYSKPYGDLLVFDLITADKFVHIAESGVYKGVHSSPFDEDGAINGKGTDSEVHIGVYRGDTYLLKLEGDKKGVSLDYHNKRLEGRYKRGQELGADEEGKYSYSPIHIVLAHELIHSWDYLLGRDVAFGLTYYDNPDSHKRGNSSGGAEEIMVRARESLIRAEQGEKQRIDLSYDPNLFESNQELGKQFKKQARTTEQKFIRRGERFRKKRRLRILRSRQRVKPTKSKERDLNNSTIGF